MKKDQFRITIEGNNKNPSSINLKNSSELLKFLQNYKFNSDEKLILKENFSNKGALIENESQKHKLISDFWAKEISKKSDLSIGMTYSQIDEKQAEAYRNYEKASKILGISETPFIDNEKFINASLQNSSSKEVLVSDYEVEIKKIEEKFNFGYNDDEMKISKAGNLPMGWSWRDFDDDSGSILNPKGRPVYNYDLISQVYKSANSKEWIPMTTLNKGEPITLKEFKNHIENMILKDNEISKKTEFKQELINNINPQTMEQSTEKVKLRIDLPNNEKPFYNRLTSVESANQKIKEASEKLNNKNSMSVSINGTATNLSKKEVSKFSIENFITPVKEAQKTEKEPSFNVMYAKADVSGDETKILDKKEIKEVNLNEVQSFIKENLKDSNNLSKDESIKLEIVSNDGFKQTSYIDLENSKKDFAESFKSNYSDFKNEENAKQEVQNITSKMSESQKETFSYLSNSLKFLGFGEKASMQKEVAAAIVSQHENFSIAHKSDKGYFKNNEINFNINFQKSNTSDKVFLNSFDVNLKNEKRNVDISQNFNVSKFGFTEKEAVNLMEGRSVKTDLKLKSGETEKNVFIKLDFNEKEENGNFKTKKFFEKYGVDTSKILEKNNAFFKDDEVKNKVIKALEKGNVVPLIVKNSENKLQNFNAILSPESKSLHLYNNRMERVNITQTISNSAKVEQNTTEHTSQYKNKLKP